MAMTPAETERLLREVVNEMRLRREVEAELCENQRHLLRMLLASEDRRAGRLLLPLVAELVGTDAFTAASLLTAAQKNGTAAGQAACALIADMVTDVGGLRSFGRLLARLEGVPLVGCRLVFISETAGVRRWRLEGVSGGE